MKSIFIQGGHVIDPSQGIDEERNLLISDGKIAWMGKEDETPPQSDYSLLNAKGLTVCPGFIDLHCHLREPGFEEKETIATGTKAAAKGGFTTICCMPNTSPPIDSRSVVDYVKSKAAEEGTVRVLPIGCITKGRKGLELAEMGELADAGVIGFSDDGSPVMSSHLMRNAMDYSRAFGLPVIDHCEDTVLTEGGYMNEGVIASRLGLKGMSSAAEDSMVARDIVLAEVTGARLHIAHVSTEGSVELVRRAKDRGINLTSEVTPHHLTMTEESCMGYDTNAKVNPPLRTGKDVKALIKGLKDGTIDIIATDHAPHTDVDKLCEFAYAPFGISGLETAFGSLMSLVHLRELDLKLIISKLTAGPAKIISGKYGKLGTLEVGASADMVLLDPDKEWLVETAAFASKGRNTPLAGASLKGKVLATIYGGKLVFRENGVKLK